MRLRKYVLILLAPVLALKAGAQDPVTDSLLAVVAEAPSDTAKVNALNELSYSLFSTDPEGAIQYGEQALSLARYIGYQTGAAYALKHIGLGYYIPGDFVQVLDNWLQSLQIFEEINDQVGVANMVNNLGAIFYNEGNEAKAIEYYLRSLNIAEAQGDTLRIATALLNSGSVYSTMPQSYAQALQYYWRALPLLQSAGDDQDVSTAAGNLGDLYIKIGNYDSALYYLESALSIVSNSADAPYVLNQIGIVYRNLEEYDEALRFHEESYEGARGLNQQLEMAQALLEKGETLRLMARNEEALASYHQAEKLVLDVGFQEELEGAYDGLSKVYADRKNFERAYHYKNLVGGMRDDVYDQELSDKVSFIQLSYEVEKKQGEIDILEKSTEIERLRANRQRTISIAVGITGLLVLILAVVLFQRYRFVNQTNKIIAAEKDREAAQAREIELAYEDLKTMQAQLIQSEKMASLGELTAGIAHEIQNPLNFVNNFSDVNRDLVQEIIDEIRQGNFAEAENIGRDLINNEEKITHHGKRAEAIVKSMLQHSHGGDGEKQLTNINELAEEYVRLAYHGLRAKDQSFNVDIKTDFAPGLPEIKIVPQDIGRVLLNLLNNAFSAVSDVDGPTVNLKTQKLKNSITITVSDNGHGIPPDIRDKIFQPFFTTKPTGQGTGLGLSLSYDIVTQGHGGTIEVASEIEKGTEFIMSLPTA